MRIVFISDLHCGNQNALTPDFYFNEKTNAYQKWVWEKWKHFCKKYYNPDHLIINGDACDGPNIKTLGIESITTSVDDQAEMAKIAIKKILGKKTKISVVNGSGYHGGDAQGSRVDQRVAEKLDAKYYGNYFSLRLGKELIQIAHGSGSSLINPDSCLRREMKLAIENAQKSKMQCPTILIRSHIHRFLGVMNPIISGYTTPCWEFTTSFMEKRSANTSPDIGGLIMDQIGEIFVIYPELYPIPLEVTEAMHERVKIRIDSDKRIKEWADLQKLKK